MPMTTAFLALCLALSSRLAAAGEVEAFGEIPKLGASFVADLQGKLDAMSASSLASQDPAAAANSAGLLAIMRDEPQLSELRQRLAALGPAHGADVTLRRVDQWARVLNARTPAPGADGSPAAAQSASEEFFDRARPQSSDVVERGGYLSGVMAEKKWADPRKFLALALADKEEYSIEIMGRPLRVDPQVMSPKYSYSPQFFIKNWDLKPGMSVLDVGTGSGILALFAALQGASNVAAVDINPHAVRIAKKNMRLNGVSDRVEVYQSDVYAAVASRKFDRLLFNAPYFNRKADPSVPLTYAVFDENYRAVRRFLSEAKTHLNRGGKALLTFSALDGVPIIEDIIKQSGLIVEKKVAQEHRLLYFLTPAAP